MNDMKRLRLHKELSQAALGKRVGLTQAAISLIEQGQSTSYQNAVAIARELGCSPDRLFGGQRTGKRQAKRRKAA